MPLVAAPISQLQPQRLRLTFCIRNLSTDRCLSPLLVISVSFSIAEVSPIIIELLQQTAGIIATMLLLGVRRKR